MTVYTIKIDRHTTVKTTQFHEAIKIAKRALTDKLETRGSHPISVNEKMYLDRGVGKAAYRVFATIYEKRMNGCRVITLSNCVRMENVATSGYNFELHSELTNALIKREKDKEAMKKEGI